MSRSYSLGAQVVAFLSMVCAGAGVAQRTAPVLTKPVPVTAAEQKYRTPEEQVLIPYLKSHLKAAGSSSSSDVNANTFGLLAATSYATTPNFGGYRNAPAFAARTSASLAAGVFDVGVCCEVTADFDKDGKPDVAVIQEDGTLNILLNDGNGGLQSPVAYYNPNTLSTNVLIMYTADVNADGYPDLVAYDYVNDTTITWLNIGNGSFKPALTTPLDTTNGYPSMVYVADVNGDGKPDLIYVTSQFLSRTSSMVYLEVQLGTGDGTFGTQGAAKVQQFPVAAGVNLPSVGAIVTGDINGDGKPDLAIAFDEQSSQTTGEYVVTTALGNGDGTFSPLGVALPIAVASDAGPGLSVVSYDSTGVYLADVNGDGKPDLLSDINGVLEVALGTGSGTFGAPVTSSYTAVAGGAQSIVMDVNGDSKPDLVEVGGTLAVYLGNGDGTFAAPTASSQWIIDPSSAQGVAAADFNGDGVMDVAELGDGSATVSLFYGTGKNFQGAPLITAENDPSGIDTILVDSGNYTANGYRDPLFIYNGKNGALLVTGVNDGKGNFASVPALAVGIPADLQYVQPIRGDFNGDGLDDLAYANTTGDVLVALAKGDGTFGTPVSVGLPAAACSVYYAAAGDINGDGKVDLVIPYGGDAACGASSGGVSGYYVALGKGDGTFSAPVFTPSGTELYSLTLADINNDGALDLIINDAPFVDGSGFQVSTAIGNGDGTFASSNMVVQNYLVSNVAVGDINGDGNPDLVLSSEEVANNSVSTGGILLITGNGNGAFNAPSQMAMGNFFFGLQLADMNHDGDTDIVATLYQGVGQSSYSGMMTFLGDGNGQFASPVKQNESLLSTLPQIGQFYNDGALDVMTSTGYGPALFIGKGGATLTLATSPASIVFGQTVTLTATLTAGIAGGAAATGSVSYYDGTSLLGSATLSAGTATFAATGLASGTHSIKAVYAGDSNFNPSTSAASVVTVATLTPAFSMTGSAATLAVTGGAQGLVTLTLTANASFNGGVTLTCSGMPSSGACAVNPGSVTLAAGGTQTATLVIGTTGTQASLQHSSTPWAAPAGAFSLATLLGMFFRRRKGVRIPAMYALGILFAGAVTLAGCSGGGTSVPTVKAGTYTVTVTATASGVSGANPQSAQVTVSVN
ncbi:MAG: hypothetical protein HIU93_12615 [Acidobacteria bacterium]|nr:hypothetical protein [Acidobacteriota bacterium]